MEKLAQYSTDEWEKIATIPQLIGSIMAGAGSSGLIGTGKEMLATVESFLDGRKSYKDNPVINAIVPDAETDTSSEAIESAKAQRARLMHKINSYQIKTPEELADAVLMECTEVISILEAKETPNVVKEYKHWLLEIADHVANAAKEGGFLGFGGVRFSEKEQIMYDKLQAALDTEPNI
ncbi:hypothetical protein [Formosa sp. A9]|uniref:hypothetical protein n=1 Tax=Formosa sp. A9 TaxID=3442641 RepID=UPI003EB8DC9B